MTNLPIVRLNRTGLELLQAMTHQAVRGAGGKIWGPGLRTGRSSRDSGTLEHWALPTYSLCYYGAAGDEGHKSPRATVHKAKWEIPAPPTNSEGIGPVHGGRSNLRGSKTHL